MWYSTYVLETRLEIEGCVPLNKLPSFSGFINLSNQSVDCDHTGPSPVLHLVFRIN